MTDEEADLAARFEQSRARLHAVALRMLGSRSEADDAVQEAWLRLSRQGERIDNLGGWLTTVVSRIALDMLRARKSRREETALPQIADTVDPERDLMLADAMGSALLVVLDTLAPAERLAFVLHDLFGVSFEEIGPIVARSQEAARQLASRARRRVQGQGARDADREKQREVVDAFLAASRGGDFSALLAVLDPDVVVRADATAASFGAAREMRGAEQVARAFLGRAAGARALVVDGMPNAAWVVKGAPKVVFEFVVEGGKIVSFDLRGDADFIALAQIEGLPRRQARWGAR